MATRYQINGTPIALQPTTGKWLPRGVLGVDGNNRALYEPKYSFELAWDAISPSDFDELRDFWLSTVPSGTLSVDLPGRNQNSYTFINYPGVVVDEPQSEEYEVGFLLKATMLVRNITVL